MATAKVRGSLRGEAEELRLDEAAEAVAAGKPDRDPDEGQHRDFLQHHQEHGAALGPERHPDPDLAGAQRHRVAHDAVEAEGREEGGQEAEGGRESRATIRSTNSDSRIWVLMVLRSVTGRVGSTRWTTWRTRGPSASGATVPSARRRSDRPPPCPGRRADRRSAAAPRAARPPCRPWPRRRS